jgi:hypothetical protein
MRRQRVDAASAEVGARLDRQRRHPGGGLPTAGSNLTLRPVQGTFRQVRMGPDAYGIVTLVFHTNPRVTCGALMTDRRC